MIDTEAHAVRWVKKRMPDGHRHTEWHWTLDARQTICGAYIPVMKLAMFPETDDRKEKVTCQNCIRELQKE